MKIVHLSDIHVWRIPRDPRLLAGKRLWGVMQLVGGRARRFRQERLEAVIQRVRDLRPDHVLITGDLTTTALTSEFAEARRALGPLLEGPRRATVLPGNHDRYTRGATRRGAFEEAFAAFLPRRAFPWLKPLDEQTAILGLDPCRAHYSARGWLPPAQQHEARRLLEMAHFERLIVACHYPLDAPETYRSELASKRLENASSLRAWLQGIGRHLYCCGHVHAFWAFTPSGLPDQLCLNAGAPLLRDPTGLRPPGFLEIVLEGASVTVLHHGWNDASWHVQTLAEADGFFPLGR